MGIPYCTPKSMRIPLCTPKDMKKSFLRDQMKKKIPISSVVHSTLATENDVIGASKFLLPLKGKKSIAQVLFIWYRIRGGRGGYIEMSFTEHNIVKVHVLR